MEPPAHTTPCAACAAQTKMEAERAAAEAAIADMKKLIQ
jgi:hypothetical protein